MRRLLDDQYTKKGVLRYPPEKPVQAIRKLSQAERKKIRCVYGHLRYGVHKHFSGQSVYITMVRDPLERILSTYYFVRSRPKNRLYHKVKRMSFSQFVTSRDPDIQASLNNHQTRMISGTRQPNIQKAINHIKRRFVVVGITEMYPESVFMMKKMLGWKNVNYTKENVTKSRPKHTDISAEIKRHIVKNNQLDYQLYDFAKKRLQKQIQLLSPQEKRMLLKFKKQH